MDLILLGGNSVLNKEWIEDVAAKLDNLFDRTDVQYFKHWQEGNEFIDFANEVTVLAEKAKGLKDFVVFAKSAGTLVTVKAIVDGLIKPKFCIFVGIPVNWSRENRLPADTWFDGFNFPVLVIQNTNDPICSFSDLQGFLLDHNVKGFELVETIGDSHQYPDLDTIHAEVERYKKSLT